MNAFLRRRTKARLIFLLSAAVAIPGVALAAPDKPATNEDIGDIVVTATKRETALQDTPVALTALDSALLDRSGTKDLTRLDAQVPSMFVAGDDGFGSTSVSIRGIGSLALGNGADEGVGIYIDGVYQGKPYGNVFEFVDVDRVEVLRGPQGTLYGRNATGGAINIITKTPGDSFTGLVDAERTSFDGVRLRGYVMAPVSDTLSVKVSGGYHRSDGWAYNPTRDEHLYGDKNYYVGGALSWTPSADTTVVLRAYHGKTDSSYAYKNVLDGLPLNIIPADLPNFDKRRFYGGSFTVDHKFDNMTLTSITGYANGKSRGSVDSDGGPTALIEFRSNFAHKQFSEELRLASDGSGPFSWIIGGLAYFEKSSALVPYDFAFVPVGFGFADEAKARAYSAFAEASYRITDRLTVSAGARFSYEKKKWKGCSTTYVDFDVDFNPTLCDALLVPDQKTSKVVTPRFVVDYKATDNLMLYASATRGFRSGGWNFTESTVPNAENGFNPEYVWSYEAGFKSDLLDRRLRLNVAAFWADYSKLLVRVTDPVTFLLNTKNAGSARIKGLEVEAFATPVPGLDINLTGSWTDAKYTKFDFVQTTGQVLNYKGNRLNRAPEWQINLSGQYRIDLRGLGSLTPRAEYRYTSEIFHSEINQQLQGSDPFEIVNLRLRYEPARGGWGVQAFVDNVTDEQYRTHTFAPTFPDSQMATLSEPRTYGLSVDYRW